MMADHSSKLLITPTSRRFCNFPKRYIVSLFLSLGMFIIYWMRTNFEAYVRPVLLRQLQSNFVRSEDKWNTENFAMVDSAFYWGYAAGQIPGSLLVIASSPHKSLLASIALSSLIHIIMVLVLNQHVTAVVVMSVLQGLSEGPVNSAAIGVLLQWTPRTEKARHFSIYMAGASLGIALGRPLSSALVEKIGAEAVYISASIGGLVWCILWRVKFFPSPSDDPHVTHEELSLIEENTDGEMKNPPTIKSVPLKGILSSLPVYSICAASVCFIIDTLIAQWTPMLHDFYFSTSPGIEGVIHNYISHIIIAFGLLLTGYLSDLVVNKGLVKTGTARKAVTCFGTGMFGLLCLIIMQLESADALTVFLYLSSASFGISSAGFAVNCMDICPRYACFVVGFYQTISSTVGVVFPILFEDTIGSDLRIWKVIFGVIGGMNFVGALTYGIFSSGERQAWDKMQPSVGYVRAENDGSCFSPSKEEVTNDLRLESVHPHDRSDSEASSNRNS